MTSKEIEQKIDKILEECVRVCADCILMFDTDEYAGKEKYKYRNQILALIQQELQKAAKARHQYLDGMTDYDKGYIDGQRVAKAIHTAIKSTTEQLVQQARIEEVESIYKHFQPRGYFDHASYDWVVIMLITARLAELKGETK